MTRSVITFDNVASKPTTRAGYGITDASSNQQYAVSYLVIGGGGGGQYSAYNDGAGGGAGGYRSNWRENQRDGQMDRQEFQTWSGAYSPPEPELFLTVGTTYTVTIGAGSSGNSWVRGGDTEFGPIFASGGGSAGNHRSRGYDGGSGGGGGGLYSNDTVTGGYSVRGQGYEGGTKSNYPGGGGGGGAGGAGQGGSGDSKNGGGGLASNITGSSVTRAGGGGNHSGSGGAGGGANYGQNGSANYGGGGGGNQNGNASGAGGSGVVILRMPTANYSGTTTGSPSVSTVNNDTVLIFNSSGSYTA